jgi:hypothetical protein
LENEVLALKQMRDDMSAKLVEHRMSANHEKEIELLRTTYAKHALERRHKT